MNSYHVAVEIAGIGILPVSADDREYLLEEDHHLILEKRKSLDLDHTAHCLEQLVVLAIDLQDHCQQFWRYLAQHLLVGHSSTVTDELAKAG